MRSWWGVLLSILTLLPASALAQMYRWVDDRGVVYYTNGLDTVPERFRSNAQPLSSPAAASASTPVPGVTTVSFTPGAPILVSAKINGGGPVTLILDTGAERTVVAPQALSRLGISIANVYRTEIKGVTGTSQADVVQVVSLEVGDAKVGPLFILAHDADLPQADGLLGRDFLDNFMVTINSKERVVTLTPQ
jgi:predicted aspartyl protease